MRPLALWDGVERLLPAHEIQEFCRQSNRKLVGCGAIYRSPCVSKRDPATKPVTT